MNNPEAKKRLVGRREKEMEVFLIFRKLEISIKSSSKPSIK